MFLKTTLILALTTLLHLSTSTPLESRTSSPSKTCKKTKVAILGAGVAGITAAQALHNASISDFLIIDVNSYIGGRVSHTTFGTNPSTGEPYVVELGANWVQGLVSEGGPENPIWTLAKKWGLNNTYSNYSSILTYDESGEADFGDLFDEFENAYVGVEQAAGEILTRNLQDRSMRTGFSIADWKPKKDMKAQAVEWWDFDWEYSYPPDQSSQTWSIINYNDTFYQFSDENNFVIDQRGFNHFLNSEAYTFLSPSDPRLLLSTNITKIDYSKKNSVTIHTEDGDCIQAEYAICTFSLGVLQNDIVEFKPKFPEWKVEAVEQMQMGTYTKIFFQFPPDENGTYFWDTEEEGTQFYLYADPEERGYYPVFQSLSTPDFIPNSGIFFVTVVYSQSYIVEQQSDNTTKKEILAVLRDMFGKHNVPEPIDFMYPRWSLEPWAMGSYSNWPTGMSIETHQNLRANLGRLWFAGEAGSVQYFGFLQGAYTEGKLVGETIGSCLKGNKTSCRSSRKYETVRGCSTSERILSEENGWFISSMLTYGFEE